MKRPVAFQPALVLKIQRPRVMAISIYSVINIADALYHAREFPLQRRNLHNLISTSPPRAVENVFSFSFIDQCVTYVRISSTLQYVRSQRPTYYFFITGCYSLFTFISTPMEYSAKGSTGG